MRLFRKDPYRIRVDGHRVFVRWLKPITEWRPDEGSRYLSALQGAVRKTIDSATWALISQADPESDPAYRAHVERVKGQLLEEHGLQSRCEDVRVGLYHMGMLVISFPANAHTEYPWRCQN